MYFIKLFPYFGIIAFFLLWVHSVCGVFEEWLRKRMNFDAFIHWTSLIILVCIILHPLLLLILIKFNIKALLEASPLPISLGIIGFLLLITYDIGKALGVKARSRKHWQVILIISTIGFILIFFHSLALGSHLQTGWQRNVWIFFGITGILATIYTYGVKRFIRR